MKHIVGLVQLASCAVALAPMFPVVAHAQDNAPIAIPSVNMSLALTTANMYQVASPAANTAGAVQRASLILENNNTTGNCWAEDSGLIPAGSTTGSIFTILQPSSHTVTGQQASMYFPPGGSLGRFSPYVPNGPVVVACDTGGNSMFVEQN